MSPINLEFDTSIHETRLEEDATSPLPEGNSSDALLKDLKTQVRIIGKMKPSLSELAARYQQQKSRIDQFVEWYANKPVWGKVLAGGLVVSTSYTIGAFAGVAWLLMGLVSALYAVAIAIMEEHADLMRKRDTLFSEDIPKMEALLEASIESFRILEDKLTTVFQSLKDLSTQRAEGLSEFEENVDVMGGHNLRYASLIKALGETAEKLSAHQNGVALDKTELDGLCTELQSRMQEAEALTSTLSGLVSTVEQELKENSAPDLLDIQDDIEEPVISSQVAAHFSEIDDKIALHREMNQSSEDRHAALIQRADERLEGFEQAFQELLRADNTSKARNQARPEKGSGGIVFTMPSLF
ncbi:MAG: hypothetical protein P1U36_10110 [Legionellaceae bacterium]|nr:hypothetical protein [Legionellaceae bacterium]